MALSESGDEHVVEAIVVVVTDGNSEAENGNSQPGAASHVREGPVMIVVIEPGSGRAAAWMSGEVCPVHQQNVRIAVIVVIDERAAWPHGFGEPFLSERTVVMREVYASLRGDVLKMNLGLSISTQANDDEPQGNRDMKDFTKHQFFVTPGLCSEGVSHLFRCSGRSEPGFAQPDSRGGCRYMVR